ncbi:hypothetical protein BDQ17DRAFT_1391577 [Cyathus striatus]|nr:hypothetical protein BDQ17DRAFT_1391577 [Cyathus striatus]
MTTLITGGRGKTGFQIAKLMREAGHRVLLTSRSGEAPESFAAVRFDWLERDTYENAFKVDSNITKIYLVAPGIVDMLPMMKEFIDLAITMGVTRFVLMSAAQCDKGGYTMGKVHEYLEKIGVEYTALRPTWFHENIGTTYYQSIRNDNAIYSSAEDAKLRFISSTDIAEVGFDALTSNKYLNTDVVILGPEGHSYDDVSCSHTNKVLGRTIVHRRLSKTETIQFYRNIGVPPDYSDVLTEFEVDAATRGAEERFFAHNTKVIGKRGLRNYLEENKSLWMVSGA